MDPIIILKNIQKKYGQVAALKEISFSINQGEKVILTGPNGAGKSTLLKILSVQISPSSGSLIINGVDALKNALDVKRTVSLVGHRSFLYDELTVDENLRFYGGFYKIKEEDLSKVVEITNLKQKLGTRVGYLSYGYKKRVDIARALLAKPKVLTLDELFSGLDSDSSRRVLDSLKQFNGTIILSTHTLEWASELCNREISLKEGSVERDRQL